MLESSRVFEHLLATIEKQETEEQVHKAKQANADCGREEKQKQGHPEGVLEHKDLEVGYNNHRKNYQP